MANASPTLEPDALFALLRAASGGSARPDDDNPFVHGPADPVVREAFDRVSLFGPTPEPWRWLLAAILREHPEFGELADGGPGAPVNAPAQRRMAILRAIGNGVVARAQAVQDVAVAADNKAEQRGIIIVSGYVNRVVDEFCATGFRLRPPGPRPRDPHPPQSFDEVLSGGDLAVIAMGLDTGARQAGIGALREALDVGAKRLLAEAIARIGR